MVKKKRGQCRDPSGSHLLIVLCWSWSCLVLVAVLVFVFPPPPLTSFYDLMSLSCLPAVRRSGCISVCFALVLVLVLVLALIGPGPGPGLGLSLDLSLSLGLGHGLGLSLFLSRLVVLSYPALPCLVWRDMNPFSSFSSFPSRHRFVPSW